MEIKMTRAEKEKKALKFIRPIEESYKKALTDALLNFEIDIAKIAVKEKILTSVFFTMINTAALMNFCYCLKLSNQELGGLTDRSINLMRVAIAEGFEDATGKKF
ncbi:MAG: hypothetical protein ACTSV7_06345 [Candidatus Baldrarchaeia archaeon]